MTWLQFHEESGIVGFRRPSLPKKTNETGLHIERLSSYAKATSYLLKTYTTDNIFRSCKYEVGNFQAGLISICRVTHEEALYKSITA